MATPPAPAASRPNPSDSAGIKIEDGFSTLVAFAANVNVLFWEMTVTPPGIDGGDAVETSTMHNETWRTMSPRHLKTMTDATLTAAYDPAVYDQIVALCNVHTTITIFFPDGSTLAFYGFLRLFEAQEAEEGSMPQCTVTITPTNTDPAGLEAGPVMTSVAGT